MKKKDNGAAIKAIIIVLATIAVVAVGITLWAIFFRDTKPVLTPDYAPQAEEDHVVPMSDESDEKLEQPEGGGAVSLTYSPEVTIQLSENKALLLFGNPTKSNQDMVLQIIVDDVIIVQSGTIKPGNQVTELDLLDTAALSQGLYEGKFNVLYYDGESGEKAILNTEIPVTLTVNN